MKAYNCKRKPKNTTKAVYRRRWLDCKFQCRSSFARNKKYVRINGKTYLSYYVV